MMALLLAGLLASGPLGPGQAGSAAAAPSHTSYQVSGVAVNSRNGAPIPFCRLFLTPVEEPAAQRGVGGPRRPSANRSLAPEAHADAHGRFRLVAAGPGAWRLQGEAPGFRRQALDAHEGFFAAVVLNDQTPQANVTLRLDADASVTGAVLDEAGDPVAQAQVRAERVQDDADPAGLDGPDLERASGRLSGRAFSRAQAGGFSQTDDRGHFEVFGLAPGAYRLCVQARPWYATESIGSRVAGSGLDPSLDLVYPVAWYPAATDAGHAETITLASGEVRVANLQVQAIPAGRVSVPTAEQAPSGTEERNPRGQAGPQVQILRVLTSEADGFNQPVRGLRQGAGDQASLGGLIPGLYTLQRRLPDGSLDGTPLQFAVPIGGGAVDLAGAIPLVPLRVEFRGVERGPGLTVTLTDRETGARYSVGGNDFFSRGRRPADAGPEAHADTVASDGLTLPVPPRRLAVSVSQSAGAYVTGLEATGANLHGQVLDVIAATAGSPAPVLTVTLEDGRAQLSGRCTRGGRPVEEAMVLAVPALLGQPQNFASVRRAETGTDGSFTLAGLVPGAYIVLALEHGWTVNWRDPATLTRYLGQGTALDLKPGASTTVVLTTVQP